MQTFFIVLAIAAVVAILVCFITSLESFDDFVYKMKHLGVTVLSIVGTGALYVCTYKSLSHEWSLTLFGVIMIVSFILLNNYKGGLPATFFYTTAWFSFLASLFCLFKCSFYHHFISLDGFWWNILFFFIIIVVGGLLAGVIGGCISSLFDMETWEYPGTGLLLLGLVACFLGVLFLFVTEMFDHRPITTLFVAIGLISGGTDGFSSNKYAPPTPLSSSSHDTKSSYESLRMDDDMNSILLEEQLRKEKDYNLGEYERNMSIYRDYMAKVQERRSQASTYANDAEYNRFLASEFNNDLRMSAASEDMQKAKHCLYEAQQLEQEARYYYNRAQQYKH